MKIKTIEASGSDELMQPIGLKKWRGLRLVAEISESEDEDKCVMELRSKLEKLLSIETIYEPGFRMGVTTWPAPQPQPIQSIDPKKKDETEIKIDNATTLEDLEKLLVDAAKYNLVSQFNEKKKQLSQ
jgi:hypothetical protein